MKLRDLLVLLTLLSLVVMASCKKEDAVSVVKVDDNPDPLPPSGHVPAPTLTKNLYFQARIDHQWVSLEDSTAGYFNTADSSFNGYCALDSSVYFEGQIGRFSLAGDSTSSLEIKILDCIDTIAPSVQKDSLVYISTYHFGEVRTASNGVVVTWTDANGKEWKTQPGSGQAAITAFQITDTLQNVNDTLSTYIVTGTIRGTLWNKGNFIRIDNGIFRSRLGRSVL